MGARWFCNTCGNEIWKFLNPFTKESETIAEAEERCICSNCMLKEVRSLLKIETIVDQNSKTTVTF